MASIPTLDKKGYRSFAITTGSVIAVIFGGFLPWVFDLQYPLWPWILLLVLTVWALAAPLTLRPVYVGWMTFALLLNKITTPIIFGVIYYIVLTPVSALARLARKEFIPKKFDKAMDSYRRDSHETSRQDFERPF